MPPVIDDTNVSPTDTAAVNQGDCNPDTVYFNRDLLPVFLVNCAISGCHDPATAQSNVVLDSYYNVFNTGDIDPGDPDGSDIFEVITETDPDKRMPPPSEGFDALEQEQIDLIKKWILQGALNLGCNDTDTTSQGTVPSFANEVNPIIQSKCAIPGCHVSGNPPRQPLTTYTEVKAAVDGFGLKAQVQSGNMPKVGSLTTAEFNAIIDWIDGGAPNN